MGIGFSFFCSGGCGFLRRAGRRRGNVRCQLRRGGLWPPVWQDTGTLPHDLWGATTRRAGRLAGYRNSPESIRRAAIHGGRSVGAPVIGRRVKDAAPCRSGRPQAAPAGMAVDTRAEVVARHGPAISAALGGRILSAPTGCLHLIGQRARACLKIGDMSSGEEFWAAGKQFFRRNPDGFQGKIAPSRGQKARRLGMLTCFKQALRPGGGRWPQASPGSASAPPAGWHSTPPGRSH